MAKNHTILIFALLFIYSLQTKLQIHFLGETIKLPEPIKTGGDPLYKVMSNRHSARDFISGKDLTQEELSQLLWCGYGPNRDDGKKTSPSAIAKYPFDIYAFTSTGIFKYLPDSNELEVVSNRDFRGLTGTQDFVADASVDIVLVSVLDREGTETERAKKISELDSGHVILNMLNYATHAGFKCVPRGLFVEGGILNVLGLDPEKHYIPITASIGK